MSKAKKVKPTRCTLIDRLELYCKEHEKIMPYGNHMNTLGHSVVNAVKEAGKYEDIQKVDVSIIMEVNSYPVELIGIIDSLIAEYFNDTKQFIKKGKRLNEAKIKFFNYDVEDYKVPAFEAALTEMEIPILQNHVKNRTAQYKLPLINPAMLVKLGKHFQKQRWLQENEVRLAGYQRYKARQKQVTNLLNK